MRSTKRIGKFGTRTKLDFPAGRSFYVKYINNSVLTSAGNFYISATGGWVTNTTLFDHAAAGEAKIYAPIMRSSLKHLDNGTASMRIQLSVQDGISGMFLDNGSVPEQPDCDSAGLTFDRSGKYIVANQGGSGADGRTQFRTGVEFRPSVVPTICSFSFLMEFYVVFDNPPIDINPGGLTGITITPL